nr:phytanoyl-CoA dioxygenase family protein [Kibdelosporangium sp. MJ126-NF4]CEL13175.1 hypothetical protein [Kibdelosporangium sp. MJ126-NF4]CTQ98863.1 hypothetical protein [Kibdelosporangium sp. MJ126-NF4]
MDLRLRFAEHGFVRLDQSFPPELATAMADAVWSELTRTHGLSRTDRSTWTVTEPRKLGSLRRKRTFDALATPAIVAAISELLGEESWKQPFSWGGPLVTFPSHGQWNVPADGWHIDFPARSALRLKWLAFLAPVAAGGGGTVVLSGSHHLVERYLHRIDPADPGRSSVARNAIFSADPWLRSIREPGAADQRVATLMKHGGTTVDGVDLRVVELTGQPGDVVFLHPHLFHAPAPNHSQTPRLMVTGGLTG